MRQYGMPSIFSAHINVEYGHSIKAMRHVTKSVLRGSDQAKFAVTCKTFAVDHYNDNEVKDFFNGHYICTSQAFWRRFNFPIHDREPTIKQLLIQKITKEYTLAMIMIMLKKFSLILEKILRPLFSTNVHEMILQKIS